MEMSQDVINIYGQVKSTTDILLCVLYPKCVVILFIMLKYFSTYHVRYARVIYVLGVVG